ncbi:unnamed protein product [Protopolystoma xenopodis]|uniref:Uncharacterized protein n=1 Tax=Protopolystoma xenopodis TaxID=117903 RepID=A0A448XS86_9PLAT|nr:unnamed protein product [Protopolystoma xenopodis]
MAEQPSGPERGPDKRAPSPRVSHYGPAFVSFRFVSFRLVSSHSLEPSCRQEGGRTPTNGQWAVLHFTMKCSVRPCAVGRVGSERGSSEEECVGRCDWSRGTKGLPTSRNDQLGRSHL